MMMSSGGIELESKVQGGLLKGLKRSVLGGESLFITKFTASGGGGWVDCAARLPGDITVMDVEGSLNLTSGAWLASSEGVEIDTKWGGFKNLVGGEGGFLIHATGNGQVVAACYGALETITLGAGETLVLNSGHLIAFSEGLEYTTRTVSKKLVQSFTSGEGFVFDFTGPGRVWLQTRSQGSLISWLTSELPFSRD